MGILFVSGLFSLQYTLLGNNGWLPESTPATPVQLIESYTYFQVIYVFPQDSVNIHKRKIAL
jgi:hypothetical protein